MKNEESRIDFVVGIDSGTSTGYAVWDRLNKTFIEIDTLMIHQAMESVLSLSRSRNIKVRVEDARQVRFKTDPAKMKGAGSVCRDAKIWEDFLTDNGIPFEMVRPNKSLTKWTAKEFKARTGWMGSTNSHGRDAAMICYQV